MNMVHVIRSIKRPSKALIECFKGLTPATVHEALGRRGAMNSEIKPIYSGMKVCGPAITVRCHPGDNIMLLKAIDVAQAGDVLVVDMGNTLQSNGWGELASLAAQLQNIEGLVTNCGVRDGLAIKAMGFPVFARGLSVKGTVKETLGSVNHPITCGGVVVYPGDLILGDDDGVVVVPRDEADETSKKSIEREDKENKTRELLRQGKSLMTIYNFNDVLARKGCKEE
jgi:4-hydroxy-4-methyl-2-oxoglutarate aldolase